MKKPREDESVILAVVGLKTMNVKHIHKFEFFSSPSACRGAFVPLLLVVASQPSRPYYLLPRQVPARIASPGLYFEKSHPSS